MYTDKRAPTKVQSIKTNILIHEKYVQELPRTSKHSTLYMYIMSYPTYMYMYNVTE